MDSTGDAEPADELADLARQLRAQLARHVAHGTWAAPGGATAPYAGADGEPSADEPAAPAAPASAPEPMPGGGSSRGPLDELSFEAAMAAAAAEDGAPTDRPDRPAFDGGAPLERAARPGATPAARRGPVERPAIDAVDPSSELVSLGRRSLAQIREELGDCTRCKLHSTRRNIVFGVGAEDAPLMFIGEAPGEQEDKRGEPFVGPAGDLLTKMIEAMGWRREQVYIANTTKCRPPNNRNPQPDELARCTPFLDAQIRAIAPRIIVTLGRPAANHVLHKDAPIGALRGRFHDRAGVKVMPTFHPAYLLREPERKKDTWADLKLVIAELERLGIKPPSALRG